jgi:hypothetical protein
MLHLLKDQFLTIILQHEKKLLELLSDGQPHQIRLDV